MKKYKIYIITILCLITTLVSICFVPISVSKLIPTIEEQVEKDLGAKIHIERLILRLGPSLKLKAPIVHMMYKDGQKFAQLDNVKFYISWVSLFKEVPNINKLKAKKLTVRVHSDDKYLEEFITRINNKDFNQLPNIYLKNYNISYLNKNLNDKYSLEGQALDLEKNLGFKNYKIKTNGCFNINSKKYSSYDLNIIPMIEVKPVKLNEKLFDFVEQMQEFDFYSDIIADLKLYYNAEKAIQASGFINIDNISVFDITKKNPKSFIYLTLWGDKASVLSNIYSSNNKKIYVEGMINNSKKPILDLKVKTDDIELADLYKKIRIFTDFSYLKGVKSITGTLSANFSLKGDLNKIKSNGYLKIINATISGEGVKVEKINSDIDFSNNVVNINNAIGYVNNAPLMLKGKIDKNIDIELLMNKVELKYLCPENFGIKNGIASLVAKFSGTLDNILVNENLQIEKLKLVNKELELGVNSLKYDTNKSNTAFIDGVEIKTKYADLVKIPTIKMIIEKDNIKIPETNIFSANSKLTAKSEISNYNKEFSFNTSVQGFVNTKDIKVVELDSMRYPVKVVFNGNKNIQNLNAQVLVENTAILDEPAVLNLVSKFEKNSIKIEDLSVLASANPNLNNDFKQNLKGSKKLTITGVVEDFKNPLMKNVRIFLPQQLNLKIFDSVAQIKGDLFINGGFKAPEVVGQLAIPNLFNPSMQLSLSNCVLDFNKNNLILNAPLIKVADSSLSANALISTDFSEGIFVKNVNLKSKYINTDTFLMYKDNPVAKIYPINVADGKFYSEKILANIYGSHLYLTGFTSDFSLDNNIIKIKNINSELLNGKLAGSLNYNLRDEHFDSKIMVRNASAAPIFDIVSSRKDSISGTMDFDSEFLGELSSKQSLSGNVKFIVNNGRMSTLGKLEHLLYAQNVIADNMLRTSLSVVTKAITLKDTGLFKYLRGDIILENGVADIKMLQSQGPLMTLFIKGQYNTLNDFARLVVLGRLSDEIISGLGAFGDFSMNKLMIMLTGEEGNTSVLPEDYEKIPQLPMKNTKEFRSVITGNIDKPSSVTSFNWISYSQKSLKQKDVPMTNIKVPSFVDEIPY